jgi:hypothetical protein
MWWCLPVIPALGRLSQEAFEFEASLIYIETLSQKTTTKSNQADTRK